MKLTNLLQILVCTTCVDTEATLLDLIKPLPNVVIRVYQVLFASFKCDFSVIVLLLELCEPRFEFYVDFFALFVFGDVFVALLNKLGLRGLCHALFFEKLARLNSFGFRGSFNSLFLLVSERKLILEALICLSLIHI